MSTNHSSRPPPGRSARRAILTSRVAGDDAEFVRNQYHGLEWRRLPPEDGASEEGAVPLGAGALLADTDCGCELRLSRAGAFHFYFVYNIP